MAGSGDLTSIGNSLRSLFADEPQGGNQTGKSQWHDAERGQRLTTKEARALQDLAAVLLPALQTLSGEGGGTSGGLQAALGATSKSGGGSIANLASVAEYLGGPASLGLSLAAKLPVGQAGLKAAEATLSDLTKGDVAGAAKDVGKGVADVGEKAVQTVGHVFKGIGSIFGL